MCQAVVPLQGRGLTKQRHYLNVKRLPTLLLSFIAQPASWPCCGEWGWVKGGGGKWRREKRQEWGERRPLCLCALPFPLPALCPNCPHLRLPHGLAKCMTPLAALLLAAKETGREGKGSWVAKEVSLTLLCKVTNENGGCCSNNGNFWLKKKSVTVIKIKNYDSHSLEFTLNSTLSG